MGVRALLIICLLVIVPAVFGRSCRTVADCTVSDAYAWCYANVACDPNALQCKYTPRCPVGTSCVAREERCAQCGSNAECETPAGTPWCEADRYCNTTTKLCVSRARCTTALLPVCNSVTRRCDATVTGPAQAAAPPVIATWGKACTTQVCCSQNAALAYPYGIPWCVGTYSVDASGTGCALRLPCPATWTCVEKERRCASGVNAAAVTPTAATPTATATPSPQVPYVINSSNWYAWAAIFFLTALLLCLFLGIYVRVSRDHLPYTT
jgi:hypothetical protein